MIIIVHVQLNCLYQHSINLNGFDGDNRSLKSAKLALSRSKSGDNKLSFVLKKLKFLNRLSGNSLTNSPLLKLSMTDSSYNSNKSQTFDDNYNHNSPLGNDENNGDNRIRLLSTDVLEDVNSYKSQLGFDLRSSIDIDHDIDDNKLKYPYDDHNDANGGDTHHNSYNHNHNHNGIVQMANTGMVLHIGYLMPQNKMNKHCKQIDETQRYIKCY